MDANSVIKGQVKFFSLYDLGLEPTQGMRVCFTADGYWNWDMGDILSVEIDSTVPTFERWYLDIENLGKTREFNICEKLFVLQIIETHETIVKGKYHYTFNYLPLDVKYWRHFFNPRNKDIYYTKDDSGNLIIPEKYINIVK